MANETRIGAPKSAGGFYSADLDTPLPTDTTTALDEAFSLTGMLSDDGLKESQDRKTDEKRDWSGGVARVVQSEYTLTVKLTFIERTAESLKEVYGQENVSETTVTNGKLRTILLNEKMLPARSYVAEMRDGKIEIRKVWPNAQITDVGDVSFVSSDLISYEVTLTAYKDSAGNYGYEYELLPDGSASASATTAAGVTTPVTGDTDTGLTPGTAAA